jgi:hypothetical protein
MKTTTFACLLAILTSTARGHAQVPSTISYQGRVQVSGTNFTGTGLFKFALVSHGTNLNRQAAAVATVNSGFLTSISVLEGGNGYQTPPAVVIADSTGSGASATAQISGGAVTSITVNNAGNGYSAPMVTIAPPTGPPVYGTYWSNDGTSAGGSQPGTAVSIPVQGGLFTVLLGDTNLAGMTAIPVEVFQNPDVHLRVWFSDGVQGFAQVLPDHPMTSVGYAMMAAQFEGPIADTQLPANIARLDGSNQTFTGSVNFNSQSSLFAGTFVGNGAGISNVNLATVNSSGAITIDQNPDFALFAILPTGMTPRSVAAADLNGDGYIDLVSANNLSQSLSVMLNNGRGVFFPMLMPSVLNGPQIVTAADINGDGRIDLIAANGNTNTLSVLTNTGVAGFALSSTLTVGLRPFPVVAADVNGDGRPDLISGNFGAETLSVLTNHGNGTFSTASTPPVGTSPHGLVAADFDGDGDTDLASVANFVDSLYVLMNDGRGVFATSTNMALGPNTYPLWVIAPDVNADGHPDLVTANFSADTLSVLTNNGGGGFALASTPAVGGNLPHSIATSDVNHDGRIDLVCANQGSPWLSILTNGGSGRFALSSVAPAGTGASSVAAADLNGDGNSEFISANQYDNTLTVVSPRIAHFYGTFDGSFTGDFSGTFTGNGAGLTGLNASSLSTGMVPDARLGANIARRSAANDFNGTQTIGGSLIVNPSLASGTVTLRSDAGLPLLQMTGGTVPGVLRLRNSLEIWPATGGTAAGRLDVRHSNGVPNITLNGANGTITCINLTETSDRHAKENFLAVDGGQILERVAQLPISRWNFKIDPHSEHIGPMAQDFHAAFSVGPDDKHISTLDANGVALAAIQGLNRKLEDQARSRDSEIRDLKQRIAELEKLVLSLRPTGQ